jgi:ATP-dependent RNA helicase DOB1
MTTEILRMMLFAGDSLVREISWVVYDEVHYMKDPERGVVWEESIILLPHAIRFVFLSATIPNSREFSEWIARLHGQVCHVVYTEHRPVPLRYFLAPLGDTATYLVRDADGGIVDSTFSMACSRGAPKKPAKKVLFSHTCEIAAALHADRRDPMLVFVFSRRDCDRIPAALGGRSFVVPEERALITRVFENAVARLDAADRSLPQVAATLRLAERGVGVHHGGLMPLMKETVEILFQQGLVKILFATETFAMGLNMPAKTVVFHDLFKFDGSERRAITSGEFIQMSGRAGRRNKDRFGFVVLTHTGELAPQDLRALMTEAAQPLNSEFRVTYNMLLNLVLASYMEPHELMRRSFHQFQMERELPATLRRRDEAAAAAAAIAIDNEGLTRTAVDAEDDIARHEAAMHEIAVDPQNIEPLLQPGRLLRDREFGWAIVAAGLQKKGREITILAPAEETADRRIVPPRPGLAQGHAVRRELRDIAAVSRASIKESFESLSSEKVRRLMCVLRAEEKKGIPAFEPGDYVKFRKEELAHARTEHDRLLNRRRQLSNVDRDALEKYRAKRALLAEVDALDHKIETLRYLVDQKDLNAMLAVLRQLEFLDADGTITAKGRIAAAVTAGDELVITPLLLSGALDGLATDDLAALFSVFVGDEQAKDSPAIPDALDEVWKQLLQIARNVATISADCGCDIDVEKFQRKFNPAFAELTLAWARGTSFAQLMELYPAYYEGSIIRTMKRLDELLNQVARAAEIAGSAELRQRFSDAAKLIERGIVFMASLYL